MWLEPRDDWTRSTDSAVSFIPISFFSASGDYAEAFVIHARVGNHQGLESNDDYGREALEKFPTCEVVQRSFLVDLADDAQRKGA